MRSRLALGVLLLIGIVGTGLAANASPAKQWSIANFVDPVLVADQIVMGPVLIVHDDLAMAQGKPCTTFYRFVRGQGAKEALVAFHCRPAQREATDRTTFTVVSSAIGCKRLIEYQIAGDTEAHGIPTK